MEINEEDQDRLTDLFSKFLEGSPDRKFIALDFETNGLEGSSPLSISTIKCQILATKEIKILGVRTHYYYPEDEPYDMKAIAVNGLTKEVVDEKRQGTNYPQFFSEDVEDLLNWCEGIEYCLTHNGIQFDSTFLPKDAPILKHHFDTKVVLEPIMRLPATQKMINAGRGHQFKTPNLAEAAQWCDLVLDDAQLHGSAYDTLMTVKIFEKLLGQTFLRFAKG